MAKVKVNLDSAKNPNWFDTKSAKDIGIATVSAMKKMIAQGISPVRGEGRFTRYSEQRGGSYPESVRGRFPDKKTRPVNLKLNGWYLKHLTYWVSEKAQYIGIGFSGKEGVKQPVPQKVRDYFEAHNEGLNKNVPKRKHLPNKDGDQFAVSVEREYRKKFEQIVKSAINKMNKR